MKSFTIVFANSQEGVHLKIFTNDLHHLKDNKMNYYRHANYYYYRPDIQLGFKACTLLWC